MPRFNRETLLQELESVQPGLSQREIVEQSSCFCFDGGRVLTYNDEILCSRKCILSKHVQGAVQAEPLLNVLRKIPEEEVEINAGEGELRITGKRRRAGVRMEADILLPISSVEEPSEWKPLHEEFGDAVAIVQQCASKDESQFAMTCVHVHPKWIEACDNFQLTRYKLKTGITQACLIRRDSIKHVTGLGMTEFSESETWIHFRNPTGLMLSCRRFVEDFHDLTELLNVEGEPTTLPKGLAEAVERSEVFSSENPDNNQVTVILKPGKLRIRGEGPSGWYSETKKIAYTGPVLDFMIPPKVLADLTNKYHECVIGKDRLKVNGGKYVYVTCLGQPDEKDQEPQENEDTKEE